MLGLLRPLPPQAHSPPPGSQQVRGEAPRWAVGSRGGQLCPGEAPRVFPTLPRFPQIPLPPGLPPQCLKLGLASVWHRRRSQSPTPLSVGSEETVLVLTPLAVTCGAISQPAEASGELRSTETSSGSAPPAPGPGQTTLCPQTPSPRGTRPRGHVCTSTGIHGLWDGSGGCTVSRLTLRGAVWSFTTQSRSETGAEGERGLHFT